MRAELKQLGMQAQAIFADQMPTIPLFASGAAGAANTLRWTGWPDAEQPGVTSPTPDTARSSSSRSNTSSPRRAETAPSHLR